MSKKMVFKKDDNLYYVATYTNAGDFSSISEKGYETAGLANASAGIPEGTPTGETVSDEAEVAPAVAPVEATTTENTEASANEPTVEDVEQKVEDLENKVEALEDKVEALNVAPVPTESVELSEDGKTATFEDGSTAPVVSREEVVAELGEAKVAEMEASVLSTEPVAEVTAPVIEATVPEGSLPVDAPVTNS